MKRPCDYVYEWMMDMNIPLEKAKMYLAADYKNFMDGKIKIDETIAKRLELFTNLPKEKWLHIQEQYDSYLEERNRQEKEAIKPFQ